MGASKRNPRTTNNAARREIPSFNIESPQIIGVMHNLTRTECVTQSQTITQSRTMDDPETNRRLIQPRKERSKKSKGFRVTPVPRSRRFNSVPGSRLGSECLRGSASLRLHLPLKPSRLSSNAITPKARMSVCALLHETTTSKDDAREWSDMEENRQPDDAGWLIPVLSIHR